MIFEKGPPSVSCAHCSQPLVGEYLTAFGLPWHPRCFTCAECAKPIPSEFRVDGGKPYHPECHDLRFGIHCELCGDVIHGGYFQKDGKVYCTKDYHEQLAPRCFECNDPLLGECFTNEWSQNSCRIHYRSKPCVSCSRWLRRDEVERQIGSEWEQLTCSTCAKTLIGVEQSFYYRGHFAQSVLGVAKLSWNPRTMPIRLVNHRELNSSGMQKSGRWVEGRILTEVQTLNGRESGRQVLEVLVLGGLAGDHFEGVLAHECGHAWLFENRFDGLSTQIQEGFCEWIKYQWLLGLETSLSRSLAARLARDEDPVYGDGFRIVQGGWEKSGWTGVCRILGCDPDIGKNSLR